MNEEKWIWNKDKTLNKSEEEIKVFEKEKEATIKAVGEHFKKNPNLTKNIESQNIEIISNVKKERLENEIVKLEKEIQNLEKAEINSYSDKEFQEKRNLKQTKINEMEKKEEQIKKIENYLRIKKQEIRDAVPGKEKEN